MTEMFIVIAELAIPAVVTTKETTVRIETQPVTVKARVSKWLV